MKLKRKGSDQSLPSIQILSTLNSHICFSSIRWHPNLTSCLLVSKRDAYQSWILSSLHAQHSRSVAADKRASRPAGPQPGFPLRGAKPSGWRVTVYNAGFSPFHALILSIVPELSQLPVHRASKRSCDIASSSVCRTPCFSSSTLFYCVLSRFLNTHYALLSGFSPDFHLSIHRSLSPRALSHLMHGFPS